MLLRREESPIWAPNMLHIISGSSDSSPARISWHQGGQNAQQKYGQKSAETAPGSHWDDPSEASSGATCCPLASWTSPPPPISGLWLNGSMTKIEGDGHQQIILISMLIYLWSNQDLHLVDYNRLHRFSKAITTTDLVSCPSCSLSADRNRNAQSGDMINMWSVLCDLYIYIYMGSRSMCQYFSM